jgi:penicillin-binding protein 1C
LEAAAWRWYGRPPNTLSWAECATLAVLPNAPSRITPGKGRDALKAKRDRLLDRLSATDRIDPMTRSLAKEEPLPDAPFALPNSANHLLMTARFQGHGGQRVRTTVDGVLQSRILGIAERHARTLQANEVYNAAIIVIDVPTGKVLAYMGNLPSADAAHAGSVDIVQARRSSGSLLKPFLYADMLQSGELMPDQLVVDLPTHYEGFAPRNYDERFDGAVPASEALARSLNVPAVRALHTHGIDRTLRTLHAMGLDHVDRSADDYGLSLIVGGAESTLWELTGAYASMARVASTGNERSGIHAPTYRMNDDPVGRSSTLSAASIHHTLQALQTLNRPEMEAGWQQFSGTEALAWKTGTSFGHRDAWAIGVTDRYAVGVWTGNADGEGRPGLTGTLAAAPILFEVFGILPDGHGFDPPYDALHQIPTCRSSGFRANADCTPVDTVWTIAQALRTPPCPYHVRVQLDPTGTRQVHPGEHGVGASWFVLPPQVEYYYSILHPEYRRLPGSLGTVYGSPLGMIYPENGARIFIPVELDGSYSQVVLHAAHRDPNATVYWDIDGNHLGSTKGEHRLAVDMPKGMHRLTLTDQQGAALRTGFHVERGGSTGAPE